MAARFEGNRGLRTVPGQSLRIHQPGPLGGLRIAVVSFDLQQQEHRGIAAFSKAMLKALKAAGAEIWLLADVDPPIRDRGLRHAPESIRQEIYQARVLDSLANGYTGPLSRGSEPSRLAFKNRWLKTLVERTKWLRSAGDMLKPRTTVQLTRLRAINLTTAIDNPYLRLERLNYLEDLDGVLCARYFYLNHYRSGTAKRPKPIQLITTGFDAVISTAPINIETVGSTAAYQVIHDLIPLEYVPASGENAGLFSQRLLSAGKTFRFFVSSATEEKYQRLFESTPCSQSAVLVQPPSLTISTGDPQTNPNSLLTYTAPGGQSSIEPFKYVLFNSSVEPRKNLLFLIRAYRNSNLVARGIKLCVTGQLKNDNYSKAVADLKDDSVILTGYVDETIKARLFLNSLIVLNPSIVEGFGIPVLDAACIGAHTIASPSESHQEIKALYDFSDLVWICDTRKPQDWSLAMQSLIDAETTRILDPFQEQQRRIRRYNQMSTAIGERFEESLCTAILQRSDMVNNSATGFRSKTAANGAHD